MFVFTGLILLIATIIRGSHRPKDHYQEAAKSQLRALLSAMPQGVAILDTELHYLMANENWLSMYGIDQDITGKSHMELFPHDHPNWLDDLRAVLVGQTIQKPFETTLTRNSLIFSKCQLTPWYLAENEIGGIMILCENITGTTKHTRRLDQQAEYLKSIFEYAPFGIALLSKSGYPILLSRQYEEIGGVTRSELEKIGLRDPEMLKKYAEDIEIFQKLQSNEIENYLVYKKVDQRTVRINVSKINPNEDETYTLVMVEDLTSETKARDMQQLAEAKAQDLNSLMNETSVIGQTGNWELDLASRQIQISANLYDILGIAPPDQVLTLREISKFYQADDQMKLRQAMLKTVRHEIPFDLEMRIVMPNAPERWIRIMGHSQQIGDRRVIRGYFKNIDELKQANLKLASYNADLEETVRMKTEAMKNAYADLESFTYSVSHDLRAPLRAIDGFSHALMEDHFEQLPKQAQHYLSRISRNAQQMGLLIEELLTFSRVARCEVNCREFPIAKIVKSVLADLNPAKHVHIEFHDLSTLYGDELLLRQVIQNLIANAIKYSSKKEKPEISIRQIQHPTKNEIIISDNGVGFDMTYYDKLFQIFQRLHSESEFEGTGVGLTICKGIIDKHNGEIWAESEPNRGTSFHITLPNEKNNVN